MKRVIEVRLGNGKTKEQVVTYIPGRYILAGMITLFEVVAIIGVMVVLCMFVPYFYVAVGITPKMLKTSLFNRFFRALVRIFAPML
ncbi:MAG: hypothetical protein IKB06_01835 [Clostridia bacterium]|nr:hypothetical protein [Clostridia bacterium]